MIDNVREHMFHYEFADASYGAAQRYAHETRCTFALYILSNPASTKTIEKAVKYMKIASFNLGIWFQRGFQNYIVLI